MVLLSMKILASSISNPVICCVAHGLSQEVFRVPLNLRRISMGIEHSQKIPRSKKLFSQDFQGFAEPRRLLPVTEAEFYTKSILEEMLASLKLDESSMFYMVQIRTSSEFGSCLSDLHAAVSLSLIDINGNSVLQRIPAVSSKDIFLEKEKSMSISEQIHFQRGSVDIITFQGPKLQKIEALWLGLESGSWRLDGLRLTVINANNSSSSPVNTETLYDGLQYHFEANNILFGEAGGISMTELRPQLVKEISLDELFAMDSGSLYLESALSNPNISADESMKEYADLKLSLLVYDSLFIATGVAIVAFSTGEEATYAFLSGGICGFLYLLLLQRSVDRLSASALRSANGKFGDFVQGFKGPLSSLALILAAIAAALKYGLGDAGFVLTPEYLFLGFTGFLTCKLSVILAAFRPLSSLKGK